MKVKGIVHNFSGKVFCEECGCYMRKKNSSKHEYLVCSNNKDVYNDCINKSSIRYDVLEKIILDEINKKIRKYFDEKLLILERKNNKNSNLLNKIKILESQKQNVENQLKKIKKYFKKI